ncbi:hypothetical protein INT45_007237 [Circinella minor]|uniref:Ndc10 domain-containing protein n=1 Tax=Circinella minor TaxID=1195481 RepID=A0A8H7RFW8_9FUNG|nr:hypothetical protein INT45_007237 [Circinella minor]
MSSSSNSHTESTRMAFNADQQRIHNMENAAIEASLACETRSIVERIRPVNTIYAYIPKQEKFKKWCVERHYPNDIVSEMKIVRYVKELFEKGMQSTVRNADGTTSTTRTGYSHETLKMHIKALVDLHNKQKVEYEGMMSLKHPRGETLKSFKSSLKRLCSRVRQSENFVDPGIGSIQDGYNVEQLGQIADYYFGRKKKARDALRDRMVFLLNHMMMLRGETLRDTNLNHLFSLEFKDEGATRCPVFVMMIMGGKTNQEQHKLYSGVIRHKNVQMCAFGAVSFFLFYHFHVQGETFPDFSKNENWFDTKLARGRSLNKPVSYNTQLNSVNNAFAAVGINSVKKTHSGRQAGAREAEMAGLSHNHIRRVGRWNSESMENNYLTCVPRTAIRVIQGFPEDKGCFWLSRALVTPSLSLQKKIFPMVEEWQQNMQEDSSCQTICGEGFLKLLVELRTIILQDAVFFKQLVPDHEIFSHEVFQCEEFTTFAEELNRTINSTTPPAEVEIQRVVPEINSRISDLSSQIQSLYRASGSNNAVSNEVIEAISSNVVKKMEEKFGNALGIYTQPLSSISATANIAANTATSTRRRGRR